MTGNEAKDAMLEALPVIWTNPRYGTMEYERISGIVYRPNGGKIAVSLELLDRNLHSVTVAPIEEVELLVLQEQTQPRMRYTAKNQG